jgi:hypothetical protein
LRDEALTSRFLIGLLSGSPRRAGKGDRGPEHANSICSFSGLNEFCELRPNGVLRSSFPLGMSSAYSVIFSSRVERVFSEFDACITIPLWGRAGHLIPPPRNGGPAVFFPLFSFLGPSPKRRSEKFCAFWCSDLLCAIAHITLLLIGVWCSGCVQAPRRHEKGKPAVRRGRKA